MRASLIAAILLFSAASGVSGQTWRELYERGEYERAAIVLHPLVLTPLESPDAGMPDPDATETLGRLYFQGTGAPQDRIVGCSFLKLAAHAAVGRVGSHLPEHPLIARLERSQADACGALSIEERAEAAHMLGCPKYGFDQQVFALAPDHSVEVNRLGIRVEYKRKEVVQPLAFECLQRTALIRYTAVAASSSRFAARHVLEFFSWVPEQPWTSHQRRLDWQLVEIIGPTIVSRASETVGRRAGFPWTIAAVPNEMGQVTLEMGSNGELKWRLVAADLAGEAEPLPDVETVEPAPPLPTSGTAQLEVTVVDRFGAGLAGATVTLTGAVDRKATTNDAGRAMFEALPDGRYDVVASAAPLASSAPRVLDLTTGGAERLMMTLKPRAPNEQITLACGGYDPRSISTLAAGADLVLHVKVTDQHTTEHRTSASDDREEMRTSNDARVIRSFKPHPFAPQPHSQVSIVQGGGRTDRGDHIETHTFNRLPPLNVGDEYVLFISVLTDGTFWIHGSEEGAFRIRNGRIDSLGSGGAAAAWKGRAAARFLEALQARITRRR